MVDKRKLFRALPTTGRLKGIEVPASAIVAAEKIVFGHTMRLWEKATVEASKLATGRAVTKDSAVDVRKAINQIYRDYSGLSSLAKILKARWDADDAYHRAHFLRDVNNAIGVDVSKILNDKHTSQVVEARIQDAMGYIKTLDKDLVERLTKLVWGGIQKGDDSTSIQKFVLKGAPADYPAWRARLIARDQTGKLFGSLSEARQTDLGITHYFWKTVGDGAVRPAHDDRRDLRYAWADHPWPGEEIECRCIAQGDLSNLKSKIFG